MPANLLSQINDHYIGVIWLTSNPISLYSPYGQVLNYLSNGILGTSYSHHQKNNNEFICLTEQFSSPFFIIHKEIKGALDAKLHNFEFIKSFVNQEKKSSSKSKVINIGLITEDNQINTKFLINQCLESLDHVNIQLLTHH